LSQDELLHYGILRKSGRYPWGSGKDEYQRSLDFGAYVQRMKDKGLSEKEIAKGIGLDIQLKTGDPNAKFTVAQLRDTTTIAKEEVVREQRHRAMQLREKGVSPKQIAKDIGIPEPTVRLRLKNYDKVKTSILRAVSDMLRAAVDKFGIVDIGKGTEYQIDTATKTGISPEKLRAAVGVLRDEGYETYKLQTRRVGTKHFTNQLVLVPPGTGFAGARRMQDKIHTLGEWSEDDGKTFFGIHPPLSISSKRLKVIYKEDGGADADGLIYVRPGVKDLNMGKNKYAQVRIMVDDSHYIKGMAVYKDDLPLGIDLAFNTNKSKTVGKMGALKPKETDADNPFGAIIKRQIVATDKDGNEKVTSALNIVNEEGDWDDWRKSVPSQVLSKQPHSLIKSQLEVTRQETASRMAEIESITNPVVRQKALADFAERIDADAVDLRAAAMPRQRTQVIIGLPKMNKGEIYAPNFETGEKVVLIRYPHGGRFEIPEVVVNNNNRTAKKLLGDAADAIGIHPAVAERLSGADFDGDSVVVIPNRSGKVKSVDSMPVGASRIFDRDLGSFNPKEEYGGFVETGKDHKGDPVGNFPLMKNTGLEMGKITNLITDMSIQNAQPDHIIRAVKHSMVVIDAEKHKLDYKKSEQINNIAQLRELYQLSMKPDGTIKTGGASTLLSRATAEVHVPDFKLRPAKEGGPIDPETGAIVTVPTGKTRSLYDPKTKTYHPTEKVPVMRTPKRLAITDDAYTLVRDPNDPVEGLYAEHANAMKALANQARLKAHQTSIPTANPKARVVYKPEVDALNAELKAALAQAPLTRRADIIAGETVKAKRLEDDTLRTDRDKLQKVERQAKTAARARLGLSQPVIHISDTQWDAIQANAVSPSKLKEILRFADPDRVRELSMPRTNTVMTNAISARAKAMLATDASIGDVAAALGISVNTLKAAISRGDV